MQYGGKRALARPSHTAYVMQVLILLQYMNFDYVSKMVYSKDKDLVFVYKPDGIWNETEYVHEVHHLEQMVPYAVSALENHPMQQDDGIMTIYDMAERENLKLYGDDKYWNLDIKDEFMGQTRSLWAGNFSDKRDGSIFQLARSANDDDALMQMKVERELKDAVSKHGEVEIPEQFEDALKEKIELAKKRIATA